MRNRFLLAAVPVVAFFCFALFAHSQERRDVARDFATLVQTYERAGEAPLSRRWYGNETFCVFNLQSGMDSAGMLAEMLDSLNGAFGSNFKVVSVSDHQACPDITSFYVLFGGAVETETFITVLEDISGSTPPLSDHDLQGVMGFALTIAGTRKREFIYVDDTVPPIASNAAPFKSILIEEVFQAITGLADFDATEIFSVLGENLHVASYEDWFDENPRGFCLLDLYLLEMQIGQTVGQFSQGKAPLEWLNKYADKLHAKIADIRPQMAIFVDERCID